MITKEKIKSMIRAIRTLRKEKGAKVHYTDDEIIYFALEDVYIELSKIKQI